MMTSSNGKIFRVITGPLCGEFTGPVEFLAQRPVTRSFDVFIDLHPNKRLNKQPWGWWFGTQSWSLWRQCNGRSVSALGSPWIPINGSKVYFERTRLAIYFRWYFPFCSVVCMLLSDWSKLQQEGLPLLSNVYAGSLGFLICVTDRWHKQHLLGKWNDK